MHRLLCPALLLALPLASCQTKSSAGARYGELSVNVDGGARAVLGQPAPDFTLPDLNGDRVRLSDFAGRRVVLEWFNPECPQVVYAYKMGPLATMARRWAREDVVWLTINSNGTNEPGSGVEKNVRLCHEYGIQHRVLLDESGIVGRAYRAETTPQMYVIAADGTLAYRGALDNAPGGHLQQNVPINYVENALNDLSSGTPPTTKETAPYGCSIKYND